MAKIVLIDSGAVVAAVRKRDYYHAWAKAHFEAFCEPFLSCEAVISESFFLLERAPQGKDILCALLEREIIKVDFSLERHLSETLHLIRRYKDTPMSYADACLVRMAEIHNSAVVFTTDSDFKTYRKNGRQTIPLIAPW